MLRTTALILTLTGPLAALPQADDLAARLAKAPKSHPRLFLTEHAIQTLRRQIPGDPRQAQLFAIVQKSADLTLTAKPVQRQKTGRRLLGVSRTCLKRVVHLAFAYHITSEARYATRAQREMLAAAAFPDWNPSHFLDVAEMTAALALGYDWLHDVLAKEARVAIRQAILEKGLRTSLKGGWWVKTTNNWNQVCHGGLSLGALATHEHAPDLAKRILRRAIDNLPRALSEYVPDGAYPEGPGYWKYGTTYNVLLVEALATVLGSDFGLTHAKGFLTSADYYLHATGPKGKYYNYSDCGKGGGMAPAMYWFAKRRGSPALLWNERLALDEFLRKAKPDTGRGNRLLPFTLLWAPTEIQPEAPKARHFVAQGPTPVAMHRSDWTENATYIGIKGGSPSVNHAHMDIGSFVMDHGGVRWAEDLGSQSYHSLESKGIRLWDRSQDSQRWTVFRLNSLSHNTLVVDGHHQRVAGKAPILKHTVDGTMPHTIVDMSDVYRGQLRRAKRGIGLRADGSVLVQDEVQALKRQTRVRWGMLTRAKVERVDGNRVVLRRGNRRLTLHVLSPAGAKCKVIDTAQPRAAHDIANPGTRMIGFESQIGPTARATLTVLLAPGKAMTRPKPADLADW